MSMKTPMNTPTKLLLAFLILLTMGGIFMWVAEWSVTFTMPEGWIIPEQIAIYGSYFKSWLQTAPAILVLAFFRNILGFARNWIKGRTVGEAVAYDFNKWGETVLYYLGIVSTVTAMIPAPFSWIGTVVTMLIEIFLSEWKKTKDIITVEPSTSQTLS